MNVTGYLLREAIRRHELRRDTAARQFEDGILRFPDEDKLSPDDAARAFLEAEQGRDGARQQGGGVRGGAPGGHRRRERNGLQHGHDWIGSEAPRGVTDPGEERAP